ncbi:MAG: polysaccharide pyruvyl transferase family protein [Bacteroidaceae bacterium]|nr:polysaccharide pyruvyl transferase family protein [Bacteroidaceae bacterium]
MTFLIIDQPINNRGDESAHRAFVNRLSLAYPEAKIQVLFFEKLPIEVDEMRVVRPNVEYINIPTKHRLFAPHRMIKLWMMLGLPFMLYTSPTVRKMLPYYQDADYVICAPGGIDLGGFQNWIHLGLLHLARKKKKKILYFARSIGPFPVRTWLNRRFKKQSLELLHYFSFLSLRDAKSQLLAKELKVPYVPTIDSAFLHYTPEMAPESFTNQIGTDDYLVLVPNSLAWHHDFKQYTFDEIRGFWVRLANRLLKEYPNLKIAMLPQTVHYGYVVALPDGYKLFSRIREESDCPERVVVLEEQYGSNIQQNIISKAKFLIGARYHSVIFSINQDCPFISLCYEHKMKGVTDMLGLEDINILELFDGSPLDETRMEQFINRVMEMTHRITADEKNGERAREIANNGFAAFTAFLEKDMK